MTLDKELAMGCPKGVVYAWDVARFARGRLGFEADAPQRATERGLLNCTRQWGKSTITAIMAVHRAYFTAGSLTIAVSPSGRQTASS